MTDTRSQQSAKTQVFRIFLASPGDVQDERDLARVVIDQIRHERAFRDRLSIEIIAWDQLPTDAGLTPQEAIKQAYPNPLSAILIQKVYAASGLKPVGKYCAIPSQTKRRRHFG